METTLDIIRVAVAKDATADQKADGIAACRTILAALGAELGKPIPLPGLPPPHPLAGIEPGQALDLLIAKLTAALPKDDTTTRDAPPILERRPMRIAFVEPPRTSRAPSVTGARARVKTRTGDDRRRKP